MAPGPSAPPRTARQRIGTIQSYVTSFDKQIDKTIDGARLWQREQKIIRDQEASEDVHQHAVDRVHAPRIAESLQRMLLQVSELPVLLGNKVTKAKSEAFESGSDPEEVESLGLALVASYAPILNEKKVIIADLLNILTAYTVSYELNVSVPSSPEEILEEMERSFEESTLQEEEQDVLTPLVSNSPHPTTSPPTYPNHTPHPETTIHEVYNSAHPQPNQIPETPILMTTGGNFHNQGNTRTSEKISDNYFNANFRNPNVQQLFDNTTNYSNHLQHHAQRQPNNTEYSKQPDHSAYRVNSQDDRKSQNPDNNPTRSRNHNTEYYSNQQQFPHNYPRFSSESNQQLDSELNKNIEAAISQQRPATCELCEGRHHLSTCTVDKDTLRRYCVNTGRCMECTSLLHTYHNCPLRQMKNEEAERQRQIKNEEAERQLREKEMELSRLRNSNSAENHAPTATSIPKPERAQSMHESFLPEPKKKPSHYKPNENQRQRKDSDEESVQEERNRGPRYMSSAQSLQLLDHFRRCTPFSGDKSYYPKFRTLFNKIVTLGDTDLDIARDILLEKVTGQAAVHRSLVTDATKAIRATFQSLDKFYMDQVSVTSLARELESVRVPSDSSANFTHHLCVARQLYDRINEADPEFFTYHHTLALLAKMPYPVRQRCAVKRENRTITPEYVFEKADLFLSEMLADEELTGLCPETKSKHHTEKTSINTVSTVTESDDDAIDSSTEHEEDTQESDVFAFNGKRERTHNNNHKSYGTHQFKNSPQNQNQNGSANHQYKHSQSQYTHNKNADINVNPYTQNQSQNTVPTQKPDPENNTRFKKFDMNGAPTQGPRSQQDSDKPTFIPDGTPDCPGHAEGRQMTIDEALSIHIENSKRPYLFNVGNGPNIEKIRFTFPKSYATDHVCPLCGPGHRLLQCSKSSSNVRKYLEENKVCTNCRGKHTLNYCKSETSCYYCNGRHNTAACKLKEFFRDYRNFLTNAPKPNDIQFFLSQQQQ